jgi:hypothetical protein
MTRASASYELSFAQARDFLKLLKTVITPLGPRSFIFR